MSIQTNFRASDMLGAAKPEVKKAAPAPRTFQAPTPAPVVEPVVVIEETVEAPVVEDSPSED